MTEQTTHKSHSWISRQMEWAAAGVIGVSSGLVSAGAYVHREFHRKMLEFKDPELMRKIELHGHELENIAQQRIREEIGTGDFLKKTHEKKNLHSIDLDKWAHSKLGIETMAPSLNPVSWLKSIKGGIQRYNYFGEKSQLPVVFSAVTTTVVGAAAVMMFANSIHTREKLDEIASNTKSKGSSGR